MSTPSNPGPDSATTDRDPSNSVTAGGGDSKRRAYHQRLTDSARERHDELTTAIERLERALAEAGIHRTPSTLSWHPGLQLR